MSSAFRATRAALQPCVALDAELYEYARELFETRLAQLDLRPQFAALERQRGSWLTRSTYGLRQRLRSSLRQKQRRLLRTPCFG